MSHPTYESQVYEATGAWILRNPYSQIPEEEQRQASEGGAAAS